VAKLAGLPLGTEDLPGSSCWSDFFVSPADPPALKPSGDDRGTTKMIIAAYGLAVDAPLLSWWLPGRSLPPVAAPAGLVVEATGLALRAWSMRALGSSYSRTLGVVEGEDQQAVVDAGPYRLIRHPGYLGSLLTWVGFALAEQRGADADDRADYWQSGDRPYP
jgi:hypothetical protein